MVIGLGLNLSTNQFIAQSEVGSWILASNSWNDFGVWLDSSIWND